MNTEPAAAEVQLEVVDHVAVVTLNAPDRRNALTVAMAAELTAVMKEVSASDGIGALVLRAEGQGFCSGADVAVLADAGSDPARADNFEAIAAIYASFYEVGQVGVPSIAAARGACVGAGMNLLLATDLRIIASDARLLSGFQRRGLHPGGGHMHLMSRVAGREATAAMALFGEEINGARAVELGMAWEAPPADLVDSRAFELAARIASKPALARAVAESFRTETQSQGISWSAAVHYERANQMWSMRNQ